MQHSEWWVKDVLVSEVFPNDIQTFYVKHGDFFGRIASFLSVLLLIYTIVLSIKKSKSSLSIPQ